MRLFRAPGSGRINGRRKQLRPLISHRGNVIMELPTQVATVAQVIQLAVAPVFLLAGVGALLNVLTSRLSRIIDAFHKLENSLQGETQTSDRARSLASISYLSRRARLIHWAISLCTSCYLLVCMVVVTLFIAPELQVDLSRVIAGLFIAAMLALIAALSCFLREINLATSVIENLDRSALRIHGRN
jgi:hypothetical protein